MPDEKPDLDAKIRRWLAKSGYALEMRVAREAWNHRPFYVNQSRDYVDPETQKVRETDVVAAWAFPHEKYWAWVYAVIECKAKPAPWILFDGDDGVTEDAQTRWKWAITADLTAMSISEELTLPNTEYFHLHRTVFKPSRVSNSVVEATFNDEDKQERNAAWVAVQSAVAAARGFMRDVRPISPGDKDSEFVLACFPIVVTSGRLFRSYLRGNDVELEEITRGEVVVRPGVGPEQTRCLILTEAALPEALAELAETAKAL